MHQRRDIELDSRSEGGSPAAECPRYDVFLSHASEDKDDVARPLATHLLARQISVFFDESRDSGIQIGGSIARCIDQALATSRFGVVVVSAAFFERDFQRSWRRAELDCFLIREVREDRDVIVPVLHGVTPEQVADHSLLLARLCSISTTSGLPSVVDEIVKLVRAAPAESRRGALIAVPARPRRQIVASLPARDLDADERYASRCELGTVWALDRGPLVGLLADPGGHDLVGCLGVNEEILRRAARDAHCSLPPRTWRTVDAAHLPATLSSEVDLDAATIGPSWVADPDREHLPGVHVVVELARAMRDLARPIKDLIQRVYAGLPLALVVQIIGDADACRDAVRGLETQLRGIAPRLEALQAIAGMAEVAPQRGSAEDFFGDDGAHLLRFLLRIFDAAAQGARAIQPTPRMIEWTGVLRTEIGNPAAGGIRLERVARSLASRIAAADIPLALELLGLTATFDPPRLRELVRRYAESASFALRRAGLVFATRAEPLMDAWIDGIDPAVLGRCLTDANDVRMRLPDLDGRPVVDEILLALLRSRARGRDLAPLVEPLRPHLPASLRAVSELCLHGGDGEALLRRYGPEAWWLAHRGGWRPDIDAAWAARRSLDDPGWSLLFGVPPQLDWLRGVLSLEPQRRAVLGLITAEERDVLGIDRFLLQRIVDARGGRPLPDRGVDPRNRDRTR